MIYYTILPYTILYYTTQYIRMIGCDEVDGDHVLLQHIPFIQVGTIITHIYTTLILH